MSTISKNTFYTLLTQIPIQIFGIISGILITRLLGPAGRGLYAIFYADVSLFNTLLGFSITTGIIYFIASNKMTKEKVLGLSLVFLILTMMLSILGVFLIVNLPFSDLLFPYEYIRWEYLVWFIMTLLITQVNNIYSGFFQGIKNFNVVNSVLFVNSLINLIIYGSAFLLDYINYFKIKLLDILIIGMIVLALNALQWHYYYLKYFTYKFNFKFDWKHDIKPFFQYIGLGHLSIVINFFNYRLVIWFLAYYLRKEDVGIYSLAAGLTQILTFLSNPLSQVLWPFLSSENENQRKVTFVRFARFHFSFIFVISLIGAITAPFLIPLLYGVDFKPSIIPFEIMIFAVLLSCQTKIFAGFFMADNKIIINLYATIIGFVFTLILNFTLIKSYGLIGASWASAMTYFSIFLFVYLALIIFVKNLPINLFLVTFEDIRYARKRISKK